MGHVALSNHDVMPRSFRAGHYAFFFLMLVATIIGCGSGGEVITTPATPPQIVNQPNSQTIPLGSIAALSVTANGTAPLTYQWSKAGTLVAGATAPTYSTNPFDLSDDGATYTVTVTNAIGTATSQTATLKLGPRSPAPKDLRFQQVASPSTANGYTGNLSINMLALQELHFSNLIGSPLSVGPGCEGSVPDLFNCGWLINVFNQPNGVPAIATDYGSFRFSQMASVIARLSQPNIVITGLDLRTSFDSMAVSWVTDSSVGGYTLTLQSAPVQGISAAVNQDAAHGRVTTAISFINGQFDYTAYAWDQDPITVYETSVALCSKKTAGQAAQGLAQQGYIITAIGGNDVDGVVMVGTRVKGDSLPRPILVIPPGVSPLPLVEQGYAIVGIIFTSTEGFVARIGER